MTSRQCQDWPPNASGDGTDAYGIGMSVEWMDELRDHADTPADLAYSRHTVCRWFAATEADRLENRALRMLAHDPVPVVSAAVAKRNGLDVSITHI